MTSDARTAWGHGLATTTDAGQVLDTWFPAPALGAADGTAAPAELAALVTTDGARGVRTAVVTIEIDLKNHRKDGIAFWNRLLVSPVFAPDGELIALFGDKWKLAFVEKEHPELTIDTLVAD